MWFLQLFLWILYGASILYGRECDDRLTLGPVIIASLISIIPIMNVFVACNAYGDLSRQEREGMTKYSLFCKLFYMELWQNSYL